MENIISDELIESTYLYCYKRLADKDNAEDLAQEILLEGIRAVKNNMPIVSFYSWYWKMAGNKYAKFIELRRKSSNIVSVETFIDKLSEDREVSDHIVSSEEIAQLNFAISRLSSIYRQIIVLFYLKEYSINEISRCLKIPAGTVKRRLFDAKSQIKERIIMNKIGKLSYAPVSLQFSCGYSCANQQGFLSRSIAQQIAAVCRSQAKTINEIADEIAVAPVYLEEYIQKLIDLQLIKEISKDKYLTDFCIFPRQIYINAKALSYKLFKPFCREVIDKIYEHKQDILKYDFYGKDMSFEYLLWIWLVYAGSSIGNEAREIYEKKYKGKIAESNGKKFRIMGFLTENGEKIDTSAFEGEELLSWSNLHNCYKSLEYGDIEFVNDYQYYPFPRNRNEWIQEKSLSLLIKLIENPKLELNENQEEEAAFLITKNIVIKTSEGLKVNIPVMNREVFNHIKEILADITEPIAKEFEQAAALELEKLLLPYVRKDLTEEFVHWTMLVLLSTIEFLFTYAFNNDILQKPDNYDNSAAGLWIIKN